MSSLRKALIPITMNVIWLLKLAASLTATACAQQYAGDKIEIQLPFVPGAEIAFFRIADPTSRHHHLTLTNYYSLREDNERLDPDQVQRAVILIHGRERDPGSYMVYAQNALRDLTSDHNINSSSVAILVPFFPIRADKHVGFPWKDGHGPTSNALVWKGSKWSAGANNQYPKHAQTVSSFEVLDQLVKYFDNRRDFPNLKQIVVAGHSLGAQAVNRYAQIGNYFPTKSPVTYYIANPNSWTWMDSTRPGDISSCPTYDDWRNGFNNFAEYPMQYGVGLVAKGRAEVHARWMSRSKAFALATQDYDDYSQDCAPSTTGSNHHDRFLNFLKAFPPSCPNPHVGQCDTVDYVESSHDGAAMLRSPAGQARLFLDNFYGDGARAADFGYPRLQEGDDPNPGRGK